MVPNADLEKVMLRHPVVFLASPDRLRRALSVFPPAGRGRVLRAAPSALTRSEETLRAKVRSVGEVLRLDSYSAAMTVVLREPRVLHCEPTTLQRNAQRLTQTVNALWGGRGGSPDRVCAAIAKCPSLLYQNSSTLIDVKLPCLCKTTQEYLGLSGVGDMLVAAPGLWRSRIRATTAPKFLLLAEACNARGMVRWRTWLRDPGSAGSIGRVLSGSKARVARLLFCAENDNPSLCAWAARQSPGTLAVKYTDAQFFAVLAKHGVSESDFKRQWVGRYRDRHREPPGVPDDAAGRRADGELKKLSQGLKLVLEARGLAGEVVHGLDSPDEVDDGQQQPPV
ncbi:unnamed protein product [Pedinophyceae sp. YPF-701]|nr:unnamed protein product [Pedinophyceae sp. YPF-701]